MKNGKRYFAILLISLNIGFCYTYFVGKKEDNQYRIDFDLYSHSVQLIEQQDGFRALPLLLELNNKYPDNEVIYMKLGMAQALQGDWNSASLSFKKSLELDPSKQLDSNFNIEYATVLILNGENKKAKILLDKTSHLKGSKAYEKVIKDLFKMIENNN